jgi:hypothetical protein
MKKAAISGEYAISVDDNGSVSVYKVYDNVKQALREVAELEGFEIDPKWNTRQLGNKLIDFINNK